MPRLRCPRCLHVFPKPEGEPMCPSCAYVPRPRAEAAPVAEPDPAQLEAAPVAEASDAPASSKPSKEERKLAKAKAKEEKRQRKADAKAAKRAGRAEAPALEEAPTQGRGPRRFFGKKKYGKLGKRLMIGAVTTFLTATLLPFAGTFDVPQNAQQAQNATLDLANGHFVLQRDTAGAFSVTPYFTETIAGLDMDALRLGESVLIAGMVVLLFTRILGARRPGFVVIMAPIGLAVLMGGAYLVQQALANYPGDVFPLGPIAIYGGVLQVVIAVVVAFIYALRRPKAT